ncbi:hypothetical protein BWD09_07195 [Neisseria dentiae]|uniref:Uncharacterized protein n=1 Tax=Neisseria dentiae TaxID=194197 RepID=A0A1X3D9H3_9NEIS|nr:hypothetical protein BWD09_07195 [Neisseria dentiae]STZ49900.1 Uncharacterised protein [Neisseria dentiae]STZ49944.1 Uncharacterised protein [Neisseria dentiae]
MQILGGFTECEFIQYKKQYIEKVDKENSLKLNQIKKRLMVSAQPYLKDTGRLDYLIKNRKLFVLSNLKRMKRITSREQIDELMKSSEKEKRNA